MAGTGGTVKLPGVGTQDKKTVYLIGGGVVLLGGIAYYRHKKAKGAAAVSTDPNANAIDPATGFAYGSPEDAQAVAASSAYQNPASPAYGGGGGPAVSGTTINPISTNDQWGQAAETYLTGTVGAPPADVASAIGAYITGGNLTPGQADYVHQAIAFVGMPPVAGASGYPPSIHMVSAPVPPHVDPTPVPATAANGYYSYGGIVYQVINNTRFHVTLATWQKMKTKPHLTNIAAGSPVLALQFGGDV